MSGSALSRYNGLVWSGSGIIWHVTDGSRDGYKSYTTTTDIYIVIGVLTVSYREVQVK